MTEKGQKRVTFNIESWKWWKPWKSGTAGIVQCKLLGFIADKLDAQASGTVKVTQKLDEIIWLLQGLNKEEFEAGKKAAYKELGAEEPKEEKEGEVRVG